MTKKKKAAKPGGRSPAGRREPKAGTAQPVHPWVVGAVCLVAGFVLGVVFTVYKSGGDARPGPEPTAAQAPAQPSQEQQDRIRTLREETRKNPDNVFAWIGLGNSYFDTGRYRESIEAYETALELDPEHADVWTDLGVMYRRTGRPEKAVEAFDKAVAIDAAHEIARFNKGVVLLHDLNDAGAAVRVWKELLAVNPDAVAPSGQPVAELVKEFQARKQ